MSDLTPIIKESFIQYSGAVLQSRALVDVRDCLKPSARQIFYAMYTDKFLYDKPYKKTLKAVGSLSRFYIHGDSSAVGVLMRAGQHFAMRYPIIDVKGNAGTLMESGNWAHQRYTESRLSKLSYYLFQDINKNTIEEWRDNYDDTEQYPSVLPTKGYYNIVNGSSGIATGMSASIPSFNLREVNNALIKLLWNPDCDFEEIYCAPDFATGAILLNEDEVRESLRNGQGKSCKLRSVIEFDSKERVLIVKEIPYGVYTNTICGELEQLLDSEDNPGIDRFNDLTGITPNIKIYLTKTANVNKVLRYLYKNTSLQYYYSINLTMLDQGRYPKVFTWKEALEAYLSHQKIVYTRGFEFELTKIRDRLHIINGLLIAMANIEEVIQVVKASQSTAIANKRLQENFLLDEVQAKAILDMKVSRLAHLEVQKLEKEKSELLVEETRILEILGSETLLKKEIEKDLLKVAAEFGDERRTQILNTESEEDEPVEVKSLQVSLTNKNNVFVSEISSLYTQRKGGVGSKMKLDNGEYIVSSINVNSIDKILFFTTNGLYYNCAANILTINEKFSLYNVLPLKSNESIRAIARIREEDKDTYITFITKLGLIKKSRLSEYSTNRSVAIKAINLTESDEIVDVLLGNTSKIGILTKDGYFLITDTQDIKPIGRVAQGIKLIKLGDSDEVVDAKVIDKNTKEYVFISQKGLIKRVPSSEFVAQGRATKGAKAHKLVEDYSAGFTPISDEKEILIVAAASCIKILLNEVSILSKTAIGTKAIKLSDKNQVIGIQAI